MGSEEFMKLLDKLDDVQKKIIITYIALICSGLAIYAIITLSGYDFFCPIYKTTGIYCPGCGLTRSCVRLIHFDFYRSFRNHPGFFVGAVTWIIISVFAFIGKPKCFRNSKVNLTILCITLGLYILFSIIRNIPGFEFLQPIDAA